MPVSWCGAPMREAEVRDAALLRTGIIGSVIAALCCLMLAKLGRLVTLGDGKWETEGGRRGGERGGEGGGEGGEGGGEGEGVREGVGERRGAQSRGDAQLLRMWFWRCGSSTAEERRQCLGCSGCLGWVATRQLGRGSTTALGDGSTGRCSWAV